MKVDVDLWNRLCLVIPLLQTQSKIKVIVDVLERVHDISTKKMMIKVIGIVGGKNEEEIVLKYLEDCPQECLNALRSIGSKKTVDILWNALGVESKNRFIAPYLFPYHQEAFTLLWHLSDDEKRNLLKSKLNPTNIPSGIIDDIVPTLSKFDLRLLLFQKDFVLEDIISTLCQYGSPETIEEISELLMRHVSELATNTSSKGVNTPEYTREPVVFDSIRESIIQFGEKLFKRGKIRPVYILNAKTARQSGEILLSEIVFDIIEKRALSPEEVRILLETLENLQYNHISFRIRKLIRSKEPQIRKMVIRCLIKQHAIGHSFDILRLLEKDDIETIRQAIIAMEEFNAGWASDYVVKCLEHPNINIKKTAAQALIKIGDYKIVKRLVFWLSHHDNMEFRQLLTDALKAVAGPGYLSLLLRELEKSTDERTTELLLKTFDGNINKELVKNLLRNKSKASQTVIEALIDDRVQLINSSIIELIKSESSLYKANFKKLFLNTGFTSDKALISNIITKSNGLWDKSEVKNLFQKSSLSDSEIKFLLLHFLREWLDFVDETEDISKLIFEKFLEVAEKSFTNEHYKIMADKVFVMLKILQSDIVTLDSSERFMKILYKIFAILPKPTAIKAATVIRGIPIVKSPEYDWAYKLIKQSNCILLDSDIDSIILKLDAHDRFDLLKDAYPLSFVNFETHDQTSTGCIKNKGVLHGSEYKNRLQTLFDRIIKSDHQDSKDNFHLFNKLLPIHLPSWFNRKIDEENREIKMIKINASKQRFVYSNQYKEYLLKLLNGSDPQLAEKAAAGILDWDEVKCAQKQVLTAYLEGKVDLDSRYQTKLQELLPSFSNDWYSEQSKIQSDPWLLRLLQLVSNLNVSTRQDHIPWLYSVWQNRGKTVSKKALDCLVGMNPFLLIGESIKNVKDGQNLFTKEDCSLQSYERICQQIKAEGLLNIENLKPLFLSDDEMKELNKAYEELHGSINASVGELVEHEKQRSDLIKDAQSHDSQRIIMALKKLANFKDNDVIEVVTSLMDHHDAKVRSSAHRCLRRLADKEHYLDATCKLLQDPRMDVKRSAIRTLSFSKHEPAVPLIIDLLSSNHSKLRGYAAEGLKNMGSCTLSKLRKAEKKARPDQKHRYREIIDAIQSNCDT